jgi:hypothetical protein
MRTERTAATAAMALYFYLFHCRRPKDWQLIFVGLSVELELEEKSGIIRPLTGKMDTQSRRYEMIKERP